MTDTTDSQTALDLLKRAEALLSALHGSVARHDNLAANLGCAGCELRDQISAALPSLAAAPAVLPPAADRAALSGRIARRVAEDASALRMDLYDDVAAYARQTGIPGLQHAQIRDHLTEFLFEGLLRRAAADGPGRVADEEQQAETKTPVHVGGNAEDCPACEGTNPPYPFICPGPDTAAARPNKATVPCSAVAFRVSHNPHSWEPQPDMDLVRCPGYTPAAVVAEPGKGN